MQYRTPQAVHQIKVSKKDYVLVDGHKLSILEAMSFAINYHTLDISESHGELCMKGLNPVPKVKGRW